MFILYLDTILVPLSLFLTIGYHAYLWHNFKNKPMLTTMGLDSLKRRAWVKEAKKGDDKKAMLAVQSLRNPLMATVLTATVSILIAITLGALANNTFKASQLLSNYIFGPQSGPMLILKYGSGTIFFLTSFICSSMGLSCLLDANFLINALGEFSSSSDYVEKVAERGFLLAVVGNRVLWIALCLLLWLLGPVPVALSSVALVWGLYGIDFVGK